MTEQQPAPIYLDYNATAPLLPGVWAEMTQAAQQFFANPSSPHRFGQAARAALEANRMEMAQLLGYDRRQLVFTSGGSEGNSLLLKGWAEEPGPVHVLCGKTEHPSVLRAVEWLAGRGVQVDYLPVDGQGVVLLDALTALMRPETRLVTLQAANSETGVLQPLTAVAHTLARVRKKQQGPKVWFHTDAVQALGRIPLDVAGWGVDALTLTAHKLGGPKGIGAVCIRQGYPVHPLVLGGKQERGWRAGTESLFLVQGFGYTLRHCLAHQASESERLSGLRDALQARLAQAPGFFVNGQQAPRLPNTLSFGFVGVSAESLLARLDLAGVALSSGSACSSGALEPSHVLQAMGLGAEHQTATVRLSLGHATTATEMDMAARIILREVQAIRQTQGP